MEGLIGASLSAAVGVFTILVGSFFAKRIFVLEGNVRDLQREIQIEWKKNRLYIDFIYRCGFVPPDITVDKDGNVYIDESRKNEPA